MTAVAPAVARYAIDERIAAGGMASVHFGLLRGPSGFRRVVAIKKLHAQFAHDPEFVTMLLDEARMASRVAHPNVVSTLDVVHEGDEVLLILEYVAGEALSRLLATARKRGGRMPPAVAVAIGTGLLHGLHAAHEAKDDRGAPLGLVHRDVSPQNVLVGADGTPKVLDFGVAKATGRSQVTREGEVKGKLPYMAPEQIKSGEVSRQSDVWSAAVVIWEMLTGDRLFAGESDGHVYSRVVTERIKPPSSIVHALAPALDAVVMRGLSRTPSQRFGTAREMALALEEALAPSTPAQVGAWVEATAGEALAKRALLLAEIERRHRGDERKTVSEAPPPDLTPAGVSAREAATPQLSSDATPKPRTRPLLLLVAASALLTLGVATAAVLRASAGDRRGLWAQASASAASPASPGTAASSAPAPSAPSAASPVVAAPAAPETAAPASSVASPDPSETPSASKAPAAEGRKSASAARVPKPHAAASVAPPRGDRCRTLDSAGIWHVKPECL